MAAACGTCAGSSASRPTGRRAGTCGARRSGRRTLHAGAADAVRPSVPAHVARPVRDGHRHRRRAGAVPRPRRRNGWPGCEGGGARARPSGGHQLQRRAAGLRRGGARGARSTTSTCSTCTPRASTPTSTPTSGSPWTGYARRGRGPSGRLAAYIARLRRADHLVFVYPTWFGGPPAMFKGWLDRVWVEGVAFEKVPGSNRPRARLQHVRSITVITTYGSSRRVNIARGRAGQAPRRRWLRVLCHPLARSRWLALYDMDRTTDAGAAPFLDRVERAWPPRADHGSTPVLAHDARAAVVGDVVPRPVDQHVGPVAEADQVQQVQAEPRQPAETPQRRMPPGSSATASWRPIVAIEPLSK